MMFQLLIKALKRICILDKPPVCLRPETFKRAWPYGHFGRSPWDTLHALF